MNKLATFISALNLEILSPTDACDLLEVVADFYDTSLESLHLNLVARSTVSSGHLNQVIAELEKRLS